MTFEQFCKLIKYIDAKVADAQCPTSSGAALSFAYRELRESLEPFEDNP